MKPIKYIVVLGDGRSDRPDENNQTPLTLAKKPAVDALAKKSEVGLCQTVPRGMCPGSDTANLSVMGYNPKKYYTGRSPLEAVSIGVALNEGDVTYRLNLVTLSNEMDFNKKSMLDYSGGDIDTVSANKLIQILKPHAPEDCELYPGVSYRHCMVWRNKGKVSKDKLVPPHDITDKPVLKHLPPEPILSFVKKTYDILSNHPDNRTKANCAWLWGEGSKPMLPDFKAEFGVSGAVISEVDLVKGIGICAGLESIDVPGADASLYTNYEGMVNAGLEALERHDFLYLHIEAPDECGHKGDKRGKTLAIEFLDRKVVAPLLENLEKKYRVRMLFIPDHATPLALKTHTSDPVPYLLYDSGQTPPAESSADTYTEAAAEATGVFEPVGHNIMRRLLEVK